MAASTREVLPRPEDKSRVVEAMFDRIAPRYDLLNRVLTFRMDVTWRRAAVRELALPVGSQVIDLACGTGDFCRDLARTGLVPTGIDFSAGMLAAARDRVGAALVRADALRLPLRDRAVDGVTCGFALRNFVALEPVLAECARVVRPGGRIALLDVAEPTNPTLRTLHGVWFRKVVPMVGGIVSDRRAYAYLPASTAYLPPTGALLGMVQRHGFEHLVRRTLGFGAAQLITGTRA